MKEAYAAANRALGNIVKVTPSSKVVGDLANFMVANDLDEQTLVERAEDLSFPSSVVEFMQARPPPTCLCFSPACAVQCVQRSRFCLNPPEMPPEMWRGAAAVWLSAPALTVRIRMHVSGACMQCSRCCVRAIFVVQGYLGHPPGGFPEPLRSRILKDAQPIEGRPGASMRPLNLWALESRLRVRYAPPIPPSVSCTVLVLALLTILESRYYKYNE